MFTHLLIPSQGKVVLSFAKNITQLFNLNKTSLHFHPTVSNNSQQPLFIYLPGMDCTGKLLHTQISLWKHFDVRCLSIPHNDMNDWETLAIKVVNLIKNEWNHHHSRQIYLCGESFGGCLALKLIEIAPQLFSRLILINPASSFNQRPWLNLGSSLTHIMPDFVYINSTLFLLPFLGNLARIKSNVRKDLLKAMQSIPPKIVAWRISLLEKFKVNEIKLTKFSAPVLIVASGADQILPSIYEAKRLNKIFAYTNTFVLPDSGHSCLLEKGVNLYHILKQFDF